MIINAATHVFDQPSVAIAAKAMLLHSHTGASPEQRARRTIGAYLKAVSAKAHDPRIVAPGTPFPFNNRTLADADAQEYVE